jgi:hypothetical protein
LSHGPSLGEIRSALEASWNASTAYLGVFEPGNPALGQCYPTSRVLQWFFPHFDIAVGTVDTGASTEVHFWNINLQSDPPEHLDLTWQQFTAGSKILQFKVLDRRSLGDSAATIVRCNTLLQRVCHCLGLSTDGRVTVKE